MFTGIIEEVGTVERIAGGPEGGKMLTLRSTFEASSISLGDSIAVSGVCLTVTRHDGSRFTVDAGPETLERTTIGRLQTGSKVNLERAMALGDRFGGHIVQGHVDEVGTIAAIHARENAWDIEVDAPDDLAGLIAPRGSITVDGISLTVTSVDGARFGLSIIPHTWKVTTLAERKPGDPVNLEADVIARYVSRLLEARTGSGEGPGLTAERLKELGY